MARPKTNIHFQMANLYSTTGKIFLDEYINPTDRARLLEDCQKTFRSLKGDRKDAVNEYAQRIRAITTLALPAPAEEGSKESSPLVPEKKTELLEPERISEKDEFCPLVEALERITAEYLSECDEQQVEEIVNATPRETSGFTVLSRIDPPIALAQARLTESVPKKPLTKKYEGDLEAFYREMDEAFDRVGRSTTRLASYFGLSATTISRWITREEKPTAKRIAEMAPILDRIRKTALPIKKVLGA
ncbi:MAG: hypothetical protein ACRCXD_02005 [Luteolibacter sp.]